MQSRTSELRKHASSLYYGPKSQSQTQDLCKIATSPVDRTSAKHLNSTWQLENKL